MEPLSDSQSEPQSLTQSSAEPQRPLGILTLILAVAYLSQIYDLLQATDHKNKQTYKQTTSPSFAHLLLF